MTGVEPIARVRFEHHQNGKGSKRIARELGIARATVRKVLRSDATSFSYKRTVQPQPKLGCFVPVLTAILEAEAKLCALQAAQARATLDAAPVRGTARARLRGRPRQRASLREDLARGARPGAGPGLRAAAL